MLRCHTLYLPSGILFSLPLKIVFTIKKKVAKIVKTIQFLYFSCSFNHMSNYIIPLCCYIYAQLSPKVEEIGSRNFLGTKIHGCLSLYEKLSITYMFPPANF